MAGNVSVNHSERAHAKLSASGASRWINCPVSPQIEELFPEITSDASAEGTLAHELAEIEQQKALDNIQPATYYEKLDEIKRSEYYKPEMIEHVTSYVDYVLEIINNGYRARLNVSVNCEVRLDLSAYIPEGFGTSDNFILVGNTLHVIDLKYGFLHVNAYDNSQLKIYAIGAMELYGWDIDIELIVLHIVQPRIANYSKYELTPMQLNDWAQNELIPLAQRAYDDGYGEQVAGEHCRFCRAAGDCKVFAEEATAGIIEAIEAGVTINKYKLMTDDELYERKLKPIGQLEKTYGKDLIRDFVHKPKGKQVLTHKGDARPDYISDSADVFDEE